jgi:hypothetical protein
MRQGNDRLLLGLKGSLWPGVSEAGDMLADVLLRFNDLRNSVAHGDQRQGLDGAFRNLMAASAKINPDQGYDPSPYDIAVGICAFMGDDPGAQKVLRMLDEFDDVINRRLPRSFGSTRAEDER